MSQFFRSILFLICLTPFQFGCGDEPPMSEGEPYDVEDLDPAVEAEAQKKALQNQ